MGQTGPAHVIRGLILAAGLSTRMGDFKPLLPLRGKTLIENAADSVLDGGAETLTVVVGYRGDEVSALLKHRYGERVQTVRNPDYAHTDMLRSVQLGCQAMAACNAFFLLPGDMPAVRPDTLRRLLEARKEGGVVFPVLEGRRRHPPLISSSLIPEILAFRGEDGLRGLWRKHEEAICTVAVDDEGVCLDLDTPQAYSRCRQKYE